MIDAYAAGRAGSRGDLRPARLGARPAGPGGVHRPVRGVVMARYRRRVSGKFVASAVAAGLILAAAQGHGHAGSGRGAGALTVAASRVLQRGTWPTRWPPPGTGGPAAGDMPGRAVDRGVRGHLVPDRDQPGLGRLRDPAGAARWTRWPAPGPTGRPARPRRSGGALATSPGGTARRAPPGPSKHPTSRTGTRRNPVWPRLIPVAVIGLVLWALAPVGRSPALAPAHRRGPRRHPVRHGPRAGHHHHPVAAQRRAPALKGTS